MGRVTIDIVTRSRDGSFNLILVEQGPWPESEVFANIKRLQERLYDVIDVALDGLLVDQFPEIKGKPVTIRLDCYDTARQETQLLADAMAERIATSTEIEEAIREKGFASGIRLQYSWQTLNQDDGDGC